jgi:hypothetical protein
MTLTKKALIAVALLCVSLSAYSKDTKVKKGDTEPVTLILKITLSQKVDPFYAKTLEGDPQEADLVCLFPIESVPDLRGSKNLKKLCYKAGEYFLIPRAYLKTNAVLQCDSFTYLPYGMFDAHLKLPFGKEITIPEGAQYVYIGSLVYELDPKTFQVKSLKILDEYESAQAAVKKLVGKDVELVRAPIKDIPAQ